MSAATTSDPRRAEILRAATKLFAREGYRATDLQDVADELAIGKGSLYRRFPSKRALFLAAVDDAMGRMRERIDAAVALETDGLDQLEAAIVAYVTFFGEHPEFVELLIQERALFRERKQSTYAAHRAANNERWHRRYRALMQAGRVRAMPVQRISDVLGKLVYGTMFTNFFTPTRTSYAAQAADILEVVYQGILTPQEQRRRRRSGKRKASR